MHFHVTNNITCIHERVCVAVVDDDVVLVVHRPCDVVAQVSRASCFVASKTFQSSWPGEVNPLPLIADSSSFCIRSLAQGYLNKTLLIIFLIFFFFFLLLFIPFYKLIQLKRKMYNLVLNKFINKLFYKINLKTFIKHPNVSGKFFFLSLEISKNISFKK